MTEIATKKRQNVKNKPFASLSSIITSSLQAGQTILGRLVKLSPSGEAIIDIPSNPSFIGIPARSCVPLQPSDIGQEVVILFTQKDNPVIMGIIRPPNTQNRVQEVVFEPPAKNISKTSTRVLVDGRTIELNAQHEIVLRCGSASIKLTHEGKIVIRGKYVISHSSGVNRVRGGSVELN